MSILPKYHRRAVTIDRLAERYKWAFAFLPPSSVVLDVGASVSPLSYVLERKAETVIAVDVERSALSDLKTSEATVLPVEASASALPIKTASVDAALLLDVLEHVANVKGTIDEIHRVVRPEGFLILSVPNKGLFGFLDPQNMRLRFDGKLNERSEHRHYSYAELIRILHPRFRVNRRHYGGLFLTPLVFASDNFVRKYLRRDWGRFFRKLSDWDNDISWGSMSYNLILLAQRLDSPAEKSIE